MTQDRTIDKLTSEPDFSGVSSPERKSVDGGIFRGGYGSEVDWIGCVYVRCEFVGIEHAYAKVENCDFLGCVFTSCAFDHTRFKNTKFLPDASPLKRPCVLMNCSFTFSDLRETEFISAEVRGGSFSYSITNATTLLSLDILGLDTSFDGIVHRMARVPQSTQSTISLSLRGAYWDSYYRMQLRKPYLSGIFALVFWRTYWWIFGYELSLYRQAIVSIATTACFTLMVRIGAVYYSMFPMVSVSDEPLLLFRCLYFVTVTMTTLGYGDILPTRGSEYEIVEMSLVIAMVLAGYTLFGTLIARLVTLAHWPD